MRLTANGILCNMVKHPLEFCKDFFPNLYTAIYRWIMGAVYSNRLEKEMGGIDKMHFSYQSSMMIPASYEIKWWRRFVDEVREGDTVIDIGAYVGILTVILAKKVGKGGEVLAFEPLPDHLKLLRRNIKLNKVSQQVAVFDNAIGNNEMVSIVKDDSYSHVVSYSQLNNPDNVRNAGTIKVQSKSLDELFPHKKIDLLKIDTEGYEGVIIAGSVNLLRRKEGYPRFIFIELHPYAWKEFGVNSKEMFALLEDAGYTLDLPVLPDGIDFEDIKYPCMMFASRSD